MTISPVLEHPSLKSRLRGVPLHDGRVVQFRGIKFGEFTERYAKSTMVQSYPAEIDCTSHGYASFIALNINANNPILKSHVSSIHLR